MGKPDLLLLAVLVGSLGSPAGGNQGRPPLRSRAVSPSAVETLAASDAALSALAAAGVPGSLVEVQGCYKKPARVTLPSGATNLGEVLDALVSQTPGWRVIFSARTASILPKEGLPPLLRTKLGSVRFRNTTLDGALDSLRRRPEVQAAAARLHLAFTGHGGGFSSAPPTRVQIRLPSGTTLAAALDALAVADGRGVWAYAQNRCQGHNWVQIAWSVR